MNATRDAAASSAPIDDRGHYVAVVAHELRGPLTPILSAAAVLKRRPVDAERVEDCAAIIERQARIISRLVDDLMEVSRTQLGGFHLERERVSIQDVVRQSIEMIAPLAEHREIAMIVNLPTETIDLEADGERLVQALQNVLSNAVKFNNGGREIRVDARRDGADAVVTVTDTGIGLEAAEFESIFALFAQCESDVAPHHNRGLGIGLYLARTFAEAHGGSLVAASAGRGRGSTFTLRIPALDRDAESAANAQCQSDNRSLSFFTTA